MKVSGLDFRLESGLDSGLDKEPSLPQLTTTREWLRAVGAALAVVLICALWTFWA